SSTATTATQIYTLSLHDALPISPSRDPGRGADRTGERDPPARRARGDGETQAAAAFRWAAAARRPCAGARQQAEGAAARRTSRRSEEHTSELQSRGHLVCRLLLE